MTTLSVLGLGSVLSGDDGVGPTVVRHLEAEYRAPPGVVISDMGTPGLDLVDRMAGKDAVIVVDTVAAEGPPGELLFFRAPALRAQPLRPRVNPHAPGLHEALLTLDLCGEAPDEVLLIGVVPAAFTTGAGLSPAVRRAVPEAVVAVIDEARRLGFDIRPREHPPPPDLWWERRPQHV